MLLLEKLLLTVELITGYNRGSGGERKISGPLNLHLDMGQLVCLAGPNGCGKSTLLRTLAGLEKPISGNVILNGKPLGKIGVTELSTMVSLVLTDSVKSNGLDVYGVVSLGRYPYSGWLGKLDKRDKKAVTEAMELTGISELSKMTMNSLSDGELQKVMLARALAQQTPMIILDEPTAHLDLPSRIQLMRLLSKLAQDGRRAILMSTHELDLALQITDELWLMDNKGGMITGIPEQLVLDGDFQRAFEKEGISFDQSTGTFDMHRRGGKVVRVVGDGPSVFWTCRALQRIGFELSSPQTSISVYDTISVNAEGSCWRRASGQCYKSLPDLLIAMKG